MLFNRTKKTDMVTADTALPGRAERPFPLSGAHAVSREPILPPFAPHLRTAQFGMGCFWGAERLFWQIPGVVATAAGYGGGFTPNPTYEEVCTGQTGHAELVLVIFDPAKVTYEQLLKRFWEGHDPTQGLRQGNDVGSQYRSAIYWADDEQRSAAEASRSAYQQALDKAGSGRITTEIAQAKPFYYAEEDHQQYLHKVPWGYCGLGGTGVSCPIGLGQAA
jgi:peptide-methionine (S)-S-oxide reductase